MIDRSAAESTFAKEKDSFTPVSKESKAKERLDILDVFRGVAIILVFLYHCENQLPKGVDQMLRDPWSFLSAALVGRAELQSLVQFLIFFPFRIGWCGVAVFFVVSGFCIHLTYCRPAQPDPFGFYVRRFFRIYPPYALAVIFFAVIFPVTRIPFSKLTYWGDFVTHLLLCHNMSELSVCAIVPAYWTIAVEAQLYLLFPLILIFARRYSFARTLVVLGIIEFSLQTFGIFAFWFPGQFLPNWLRATPIFYWFSWTTGAAIADAYLTGKPLPFKQIHPALWLVLGVIAELFPFEPFSFPFFALFTASLISRGLSGESKGEKDSRLVRFIRLTGVYSYSIYLIHDPLLLWIVGVYKNHFPDLENQPFLIFAAALSSWILVFPLGALMYYMVEKPSISWGKRLLRAWSQRAAPQVGVPV